MDLPDFDEDRALMVTRQLAGQGIRDARVLAAMGRVARHDFIPPALWEQAYADHPLPIGCNQTISQPYMVALMSEALEVRPGDRVLEIGTGSGYQTAILAALAREVVTIERHAELADAARERFTELRIGNVKVAVGDGTVGFPEAPPFDGILVTAAGPKVPPALLGQLALNGRLVCPVGDRELQWLIKVVRTEGGFEQTRGARCVFVPLIGQEGWPGVG